MRHDENDRRRRRLLFEKHFREQNEHLDAIAERIQVLGGVSIAMGPDVADMTLIPRPPKGREEVPVQIAGVLHAHEIVLRRHGRWRGSRPAPATIDPAI